MKYFFYPKRRFVTFAPIMNNNSKSPVSDLQYQQLLLRMEYEYEKEEFKRQTETMGIARKVKRGLCWYPVSPGRSYYNSLNQLVIDITRTENKEIEHSFEFGRPVCFFHQSFDGKVKYMNFIATVSYADEERMVVVLPGAGAVIELQADSSLGIQLYFDETSYRTMFEALEDAIRAKGNRLSELRDILLGTQNPGFRELYPVRFPWLNSTQETAVNKVLCTRDVAIVHGPPGTGKTTISNALSRITGFKEVDVDQYIVEKEGMAIKDIFAENGEQYFRDLETQALRDLQEEKETIISCGGGAVLRDENVEILNTGSVIIQLKATPETVFERVKDHTHRPILNNDMSVRHITELMNQREPRYNSVADIQVNVDKGDRVETCYYILKELEKTGHFSVE